MKFCGVRDFQCRLASENSEVDILDNHYLGHRIVLQTFNDAQAASWGSLCEAHLALWSSTCNDAAHLDRQFCAACTSAVKSKRPLEIPAKFQAESQKKLKPSDFCKNGCTSERAVLKRAYRVGLCFLCYNQDAQSGADSALEVACFSCASKASDVVERACQRDTCARNIPLCSACTNTVHEVSCETCWKGRWNGQCYLCKAVPAQKGEKFGRLCKSCYNDQQGEDKEVSCFFCGDKSDVERQMCSSPQGLCERRVDICTKSVSLHDAVVCRRCWERDWSKSCFRCGQK